MPDLHIELRPSECLHLGRICSWPFPRLPCSPSLSPSFAPCTELSISVFRCQEAVMHRRQRRVLQVQERRMTHLHFNYAPPTLDHLTATNCLAQNVADHDQACLQLLHRRRHVALDFGKQSTQFYLRFKNKVWRGLEKKGQSSAQVAWGKRVVLSPIHATCCAAGLGAPNS